MAFDRRCPCCEELIDSYGCSCGPSPFREAQRHRTLYTDDDVVIRLNDVRMAEDNGVADAS
jgi:hypothetical protein